jgi:hypothetical protein
MIEISIGYNYVMSVGGTIWMSDYGDDFEDIFDESLNALKGMIRENVI